MLSSILTTDCRVLAFLFMLGKKTGSQGRDPQLGSSRETPEPECGLPEEHCAQVLGDARQGAAPARPHHCAAALAGRGCVSEKEVDPAVGAVDGPGWVLWWK